MLGRRSSNPLRLKNRSLASTWISFTSNNVRQEIYHCLVGAAWLVCYWLAFVSSQVLTLVPPPRPWSTCASLDIIIVKKMIRTHQLNLVKLIIFWTLFVNKLVYLRVNCCCWQQQNKTDGLTYQMHWYILPARPWKPTITPPGRIPSEN